MEAGQKWQTASIQLEWYELSNRPKLPPHLSTSHCCLGSPRMGGDTGIESPWGAGWWLGPPPLHRLQPGAPPPARFPSQEGKEGSCWEALPCSQDPGLGRQRHKGGDPGPRTEDGPAAAHRKGEKEQEPRSPQSSFVGTGSYAKQSPPARLCHLTFIPRTRGDGSQSGCEGKARRGLDYWTINETRRRFGGYSPVQGCHF